MPSDTSIEALTSVVMALEERERSGPCHIEDLALIASVERVNGSRLTWYESFSFARGLRVAMSAVAKPTSNLSDWSGLPRDMYVTSVRRVDQVVWEATFCSVPMAIGPEVRYQRYDAADARVAELEAALKPFAAMPCGICENDDPVIGLERCSDDTPVYVTRHDHGGQTVTAGHFRAARAVLGKDAP